jgi:hypothetical protein
MARAARQRAAPSAPPQRNRRAGCPPQPRPRSRAPPTLLAPARPAPPATVAAGRAPRPSARRPAPAGSGRPRRAAAGRAPRVAGRVVATRLVARARHAQAGSSSTCRPSYDRERRSALPRSPLPARPLGDRDRLDARGGPAPPPTRCGRARAPRADRRHARRRRLVVHDLERARAPPTPAAPTPRAASRPTRTACRGPLRRLRRARPRRARRLGVPHARRAGRTAASGLSMGATARSPSRSGTPTCSAAAASHSGVLAPLLAGPRPYARPARWAPSVDSLAVALPRLLDHAAAGDGARHGGWWARDPGAPRRPAVLARCGRRSSPRSTPTSAPTTCSCAEPRLRDAMAALGVPLAYAVPGARTRGPTGGPRRESSLAGRPIGRDPARRRAGTRPVRLRDMPAAGAGWTGRPPAAPPARDPPIAAPAPSTPPAPPRMPARPRVRPLARRAAASLALAAGLARPAAAQAPRPAPERPFGTLREQAALQQRWLDERLRTVLPALMREHGVDAGWCRCASTTRTRCSRPSSRRPRSPPGAAPSTCSTTAAPATPAR